MGEDQRAKIYFIDRFYFCRLILGLQPGKFSFGRFNFQLDALIGKESIIHKNQCLVAG
jgi:hypothetical protein